MACIFHCLFSVVLLFNVSACQTKTKVEKASEKLGEHLVAESLTKPILMIQEQPFYIIKISSKEELKEFISKKYHLPSIFNKELRALNISSDHTNKVIALEVEGEKKHHKNDKEREHIIYVKEQQKENLLEVRKKEDSYMSISTKGTGKKRADSDIVKYAFFNHKEMEKRVNKMIKHNNVIPFSTLKANRKNSLLGNQHRTEGKIQNQVKDVFMNAKEDAMIILHSENKKTFPKKIKLYIPEFKSRGFRLLRNTLKQSGFFLVLREQMSSDLDEFIIKFVKMRNY
ncbi:hypothetical protein [Sutcliffiella rhizosphaerae]|uniref:Uncharacterized protein n=1 Tax=Sutcliffiella rhizosphaerae TaxID=2880967 RepID=A0ABM8YLE0_9BACI|nr:hypothetical protein [Sutcliffiella rhizosphaerae]CAG9620568.1 hypothetical protein BACCIP111883_01337 [Sutcliffiella rhizosphaerae]